ncbi:MAG TPA: hypothetical protein VGM29_05070, partial [Polyangiaceae bacterium]
MANACAVRVGVAAAMSLVSASATAAEIRWAGDPACRREPEVAEQVASMTGREVASIGGADFELDARQASDGTWQLELKTVRRADGNPSTRTLHGKTCVEVTDAAAVAIALAVGPNPEPAGVPASAPPAPESAPAPESTPQPTAPKARVLPSKSSLAWFAGLSGVLDSSITPQVALGAALHGGVSFRPSRRRET